MNATTRLVRFSARGQTVSGEAALHPDQGAWLLAAAATTLAPHLLNLPAWTIILCATLLAWRGWRLWHGQSAPPRWLLLPLALAAALAVRITFGHFLGKTPGLALLAVLLCLKMLEIRNMRDIHVVVLLCFFLQFGMFFSNQSAPAALLALVAATLTLGGQISLLDPASSGRERLRTSALLLAQGAPLMLLLFVLFPRAVSPLWGIPEESTASTGLSDSMAPGSISEMILSDELAFTVEFDGPRPPPSNRYWRGPVLTRFDGFSWHLAPRPTSDRPTYTPSGRRYDYRIMLEPHNQHWLPALYYPAGPVPGVRFAYDYQTLSRSPVGVRVRIDFSAYPDTVVGRNERPWVVQQALQLPNHGNAKARVLARELKAGTPAHTVERILDWFVDGGFAYTLQPPLMTQDSVDYFLFDARRGFCEHFAGAFVFLARAADVPARVVTGYQGGYLNPINKMLMVRQSDAHAWAEVWLAERGWVRVDPTAIVAPLRIEGGLADSLRDGLPFMLRPEYSWLRQWRDRWEALGTRWNRITAYDNRRQHDLLESFGFGAIDSVRLLGAIAIGAALMLAAFYYWALRSRDPRDPLARAWGRFSAYLARFDLARKPAEGPLDYGRRLAAARPADADTLNGVCTRYARLRYRPPVSGEAIRELARDINALDI
ncbi:MAG: DUF3488 and transglutaminase-like domain-containing protein [Azoarcus sp.]|nr:DUF3488 and transglutaminase-like domain-containing protein [Azoarcus sp.]